MKIGSSLLIPCLLLSGFGGGPVSASTFAGLRRLEDDTDDDDHSTLVNDTAGFIAAVETASRDPTNPSTIRVDVNAVIDLDYDGPMLAPGGLLVENRYFEAMCIGDRSVGTEWCTVKRSAAGGRFFYGEAPFNVAFSGFRFEGGSAPTSLSQPNRMLGGAFYLGGSGHSFAATFADCSFASNNAPSMGGALYISGEKASVSFNRCTFDSNTISTPPNRHNYFGGGAIAAIVSNHGGKLNIIVAESAFSNNDADGAPDNDILGYAPDGGDIVLSCSETTTSGTDYDVRVPEFQGTLQSCSFTAVPSSTPSISTAPSSAASAEPSSAPSNSNGPSSTPSAVPSSGPSISSVPTNVPSAVPSGGPSCSPSTLPSTAPSSSPSTLPSTAPSYSVVPSPGPTESPSVSSVPSVAPSTAPSIVPSAVPSTVPSTSLPSSSPSPSPPSTQPSSVPSHYPSTVQSSGPSVSVAPSNAPTNSPSTSVVPSSAPSILPTIVPSALPSIVPSTPPSIIPSAPPSALPTTVPSTLPSNTASNVPTSTPSTGPSQAPSRGPYWKQLAYDDFEGGWGHFDRFREHNTEGILIRNKNAIRMANANSDQQDYVQQGNAALRIRKNNGIESSVWYKEDFNVTGYSDLRVSFSFCPRSMEKTESFVLEYSSDGGGNWAHVKRFIRLEDPGYGIDSYYFYFGNNKGCYNDIIPLSTYDLNLDTTRARIRFRCEASGSGDYVYIDEVKFEGLVPAGN